MIINNRMTFRAARRRRRLVVTSLTLIIIVVGLVTLHTSATHVGVFSTSATAGGRSGNAAHGSPTAADGKIFDGQRVSVYDEEVPAIGNLDAKLLTALQRAATDAENDGVAFLVNSGWRSAAFQEQLLQDAISEYGSRDEAARWVATPDTSAHVAGQAVDLGPLTATDWLAQHGSGYGLCQTYANESWHYELRPEAATAGCPEMYADATQDPRRPS